MFKLACAIEIADEEGLTCKGFDSGKFLDDGFSTGKIGSTNSPAHMYQKGHEFV